MRHFHLTSMLLGGLLFAAVPTSTNYTLNNYGFGSGGTANSTSTNYGLNATTGQPASNQQTSTNYTVRPGLQQAQQAYVPVAPTFTNPSSYYNKLKFVLNPGASPSDTKFSIAVSTDNFVTTKYVQLDDTLGASKVYQTYANWGGASGQTLIGLTYSTTYQMKANAMQTNFTETEYGPAASASTVAPTINYDIDTSAADTETASPYAVSFTSLLPGTVVTGTQRIWLDLNTNAVSGAGIYIRDANGGLKSNTANSTITSATANLAVASSGFGAQGASATQGSGGPMTITAPYNVAAQNVGIIDTTIRQIFSTTAPVTAGRTSLYLMAKSSSTTKAANDYGDTLTLTVAGVF